MNIKIMKNKNLSLLMLGKFVSLTGTQMQEFALSLFVLKMTGSATLFSSVLIVALIPQLILSPIAGVFADWFDRKKIIVYLDFISCLLVLLFAGIYIIYGTLSMPAIYALAIMLTLISSLYQPAISTIIPTIVDKSSLVDANGMDSLIRNLGNLLAPLVAGILFGYYGLLIILLINAVSFLLSGLVNIFINIPKTNKMPQKISFKVFHNDFKEGIAFIMKQKLILYIVILGSVLNFVFSPLFSTALTFITKQLFKISDAQYGFMQMVIVSSMLIAPFVTGQYTKNFSLGKLIYFNFFICSILIGIMAIIPSPLFLSLFNSNLIPYISMTLMFFIITLLITIINIALSSLFQKIVPLSMMGRVSTVMNTCCMATMPLGLLLFGALFDSISAWICVALCAIILLVAILMFKKALLTYDNDYSSNLNPSEALEAN